MRRRLSFWFNCVIFLKSLSIIPVNSYVLVLAIRSMYVNAFIASLILSFPPKAFSATISGFSRL